MHTQSIRTNAHLRTHVYAIPTLSHPPTFSRHTAPKFLQALKDFGDVDEEAISEAHLLTEYSQLQQQVRRP